MCRRALYKGMKISTNPDYIERKAAAQRKLQHTIVPNNQYPYLKPSITYKEPINQISIFYDPVVSFK